MVEQELSILGNYPNTYTFSKAFAERAQYLADTYGDVFAVPQLLKDKAANGETF